MPFPLLDLEFKTRSLFLEAQLLRIDFSLHPQFSVLDTFPSAMSSTVFVKVVVGAILLLTIKVLLTRKKKSGPLPPGPSPKAFIGNISDLPPAGAQDWMHWAKHKELYGQ